MKIRLRIADVELEYESETLDQTVDPSCCSDKYSGKAKNDILLKTINEMSEQVQAMYYVKQNFCK